MIIVRLWGGLGNQMFQYAYGYTLAKKLNVELRFDTSFYNKEPAIMNLKINEKVLIDKRELPKWVQFFKNRAVNKLIRVPPRFFIPVGSYYHYLKETRFKYCEAIANYNKDNTYLDGYWQCPEYFESEMDLLKEQFRIKDDYSNEITKLMNLFQKENSVAVHIRHGDYMNLKNRLFSKLVVLKKGYYTSCFREANKLIRNPKFYFFTDDPEWVKQEYGDMTNAVVVSGNINCSDIEEMTLMSSCKNHIIANSTFSWWAAWLNQNPEKMVWAPINGWGNKDILPNRWIAVNVAK